MSTSFRQNTQTPVASKPAGGAQPMMLPMTTAAQAKAEAFFKQSGTNSSTINTLSMVPNQSVSFNLINTGLTNKVLLGVKGSLSYVNTSASAQAVSLAPEFPACMMSNVSVIYNGQVTIFTASGYEIMGLAAKRGKNYYTVPTAGGVYSQSTTRVTQKTASVSAGANVTLTAGNGLTGYSGFSVAGSSTGVLNWSMVLEIPFTLRDDLPYGILPLQNNSIIAQVNITSPAWLGSTVLNPTYITGGVPGTFTIGAASYANVQPVQHYWETPADVKSYAEFVANSYMYISTPGQSFKNTGQQALQYQMPNNYILTGLLFTLRDANSALIDCYTAIDNPTLNYNNTTFVEKMPQFVREYLQEKYYEATPTGLGQVLWDGTALQYLSNGMLSANWLDMYKANNPQFFMDIASTVAVPGSFSIVREMIVPSAIKTA